MVLPTALTDFVNGLIGQPGLATELRDGRAEFDPHGALIGAVIARFRQGGPGDAGSNGRRIGQYRPYRLRRGGDGDLLADRNHWGRLSISRRVCRYAEI